MGQKRDQERVARIGLATVHCEDALDSYGEWPDPTVIVVDGPYGIGGYPGDPKNPDRLPEIYRPHVEVWSDRARSTTSLWFWGTEISWASVHPVLAECGWIYRGLHIWDKGIAHIAGNVNGQTIRRFPIVTEVCAQYVREAVLPLQDGTMAPVRVWFREEWRRSGLTLKQANEACGVRDAAARKYLTTEEHNWYCPPQEILDKLIGYANKHGERAGRPYFYIDGVPFSNTRWQSMRPIWNHKHGITNVWSERAVRGGERMRGKASKILHSCQKPARLIQLTIEASSNQGDVVWEPFGGLCTACAVSNEIARPSFAAENNPEFFQHAVRRLENEAPEASSKANT